MKLNAITLTTTDLPDKPHLIYSSTWRYGDPLSELEELVVWLDGYITLIKNPIDKAISGSKPIEL